MADILRFIIPFFEKILFERQDNEHPVNMGAYGLYTAFFPGPDLGRDIIDRTQPLLVGPGRQTEIKSGIVDENQPVGFKMKDVFFTEFDIPENSRQVADNFSK